MRKMRTLVVAIPLAFLVFASTGATQEQLVAPHPEWSAPAPLRLRDDAISLQSGALKLSHDPGTFGAFRAGRGILDNRISDELL
jgi:hypothetical protein